MLYTSLALLLPIWATTTTAFVVQPVPLQTSFHLPSGTTSLFASRNRDKIASRTAWLERRGVAVDDTDSTTAAATAGLFKNEHGLDYVQLVHPDSGATCQVYPYGACVTSYVQDGVDYIAVRPDAKMDGSKPISGGLSHCWPQFGPGAIQQHGFARNLNWQTGTMTGTSVEMILTPTDYTKEMWDHDFACRFSVTLQADQLDTSMVVENKASGDKKAFDFQAALHSYYTISSLENMEISGSFAGKEFINKVAGETQTEKRDVITISEEYDRVYMGVNDPVLSDKGTNKKLQIINAAGWEDTVLWNPYGNEGMGYNNFVCVESVKFDPVTLAAGESWTGEMSLKPADLK